MIAMETVSEIFAGMTQKLDYLVDLGVDVVWLMPINPSPSYHKYDVVDYYGVHPDYGTMEEFQTFVQEAHQTQYQSSHRPGDQPLFEPTSLVSVCPRDR